MQINARPGVKFYQFLRSALLVLIVVAFVNYEDVSAQSSRAEEITQKQAEKAKQLQPYVPNKAERILIRVQELPFVGGAPRGFYPALVSAFPGGGIAGGPGYRALIGDNGFWDIHGAWSIANYRMADTTLRLSDFGDGVFKTHFNAHYAHADKVRFYGIGNDSLEENLTRFTYKPLTFSATERIQATHWLALGGGIDYMLLENDTGGGTDPSIEELFSPAEAPGLFIDFEYLRPRAFVEIDYREAPGYTTSGGFYRADYSRYSERDLEGFDFDRVDVEIDQFFPLLRANWVLAFRGLASVTNTDGPNQIPYFLLPRLGGGTFLRGFPDYRFIDNHRMLLTAELRWTPSKFLDMALWYETGKVAADKSDLDFEDLHDCWGIGARFHGPMQTPLRIEIAFSDEATRLIFSAGPSF